MTPPPKNAYITGKALTCALGNDLGAAAYRMQKKKREVQRIPLHLAGSPDTRPYYQILEGNSNRTPCDRFYEILFSVTDLALKQAELTPGEITSLGLFFGSTAMDISIYEAEYETSQRSFPDIFSKTSAGYGIIAGEVSRRFGIRGPCYTFNTACTSGANALMYAADHIRAGKLQQALVIGYDLYSNLGFYGFESLKLLSATDYKPFDRRRDGIILGEGCGAMVLDYREKASGDFRILGAANGCDIHNVAVHDESGKTIAHVMESALRCAGVSPREIDAVKAHATGTEQNDISECNALRRVFGDNLPPVTGIKPYIGHTVGAGGVVESILLTESVERGIFPPTAGFAEYDPALGVLPVTSPLSMDNGLIMLNFFGFGGNCTTLVLSNKG